MEKVPRPGPGHRPIPGPSPSPGVGGGLARDSLDQSRPLEKVREWARVGGRGEEQGSRSSTSRPRLKLRLR